MADETTDEAAEEADSETEEAQEEAAGGWTFYGHNRHIYDPNNSARYPELLHDGRTDSNQPLTAIVQRTNTVFNNVAMTGQPGTPAASIGNDDLLIAVVTEEIRMFNLGEIYQDYITLGLQAEVDELRTIASNETTEIGLDPHRVPVVRARIEELMPMYPRPTSRGCGSPAISAAGSSVESTLYSKTFIGHPSHTADNGGIMPSVGSLIAVRFENGRWQNSTGYMVGILSLNRTLPYTADPECEDEEASNASDTSQEEPLMLSQEEVADEINAAADRNTPIRDRITRRFSQGQGGSAGIGPDGQRALTRGGAADFASSFWQSATADRSAAADTEPGSAAAAESRREQKPSNN